MFKLHTFKELIEDKCCDKIFESIRIYVEDNPDVFGECSNTIDTPEEAELSDIQIKFVTINEESTNGLKFDVVVSSQILVSQRMPHSYSESDGIEQWFRVGCSAELEEGLHNFQVFELQTYIKVRNQDDGGLSEYLVPITYKNQLEDIAEDFLKRYYPQALQIPMAIPTFKLVESMGLTIKQAHITKTCSVFGQVYFSDCKTKYYDCGTNEYETMEVKRGTIIVDPNVFFLRNLGSVNNTIIHECVHWDRHKKFFELSKIYNPTIKSIICQVHEGKKIENNGTPFEWMEWQANALAPRILMPAKTTKIKIDELIEKNKRIFTNGNRADILESVIYELSEFFDVSKVSAKIRLLDLGYKEAEGVFTYVDDHYVLNYCFEENALKRGQTYTIGTQEALIQYVSNFRFREIIDSGNYVFVDNHFCINNTKYLKYNELGHPILTDYARQHIDECCFVFNLKARRNNQYGSKYYSECSLFRSAIANKIIDVVYDIDSKQNADVVQRAHDLMDTTRDILKINAELPRDDFGETLIYHMDRKKCTIEKLEEKSLINYKTIQRMRKSDDGSLSMENVIAISIGLQLYPDFSKDLIKKAGIRFKGGNEKHFIYKMLIEAYYNNSIYYCNEILIENKFKPLGSKGNI